MNAEWMWHVVSVGELFPGNMGINVRRVQQTMEGRLIALSKIFIFLGMIDYNCYDWKST